MSQHAPSRSYGFLLAQMMEGFLDATSGSIQIEGHSVHSGMEGIAGLVGICPQHDLLWESLTGREHLLFYARLHAFTVSKHISSSWPCCGLGTDSKESLMQFRILASYVDCV